MVDKKNSLPFQLRGYEVTGNDQNAWGTEHDFHFKAGEMSDTANYRFAKVAFFVGGTLRNKNDLDVVTDFLAHMYVQPKNGKELRGKFVTSLTPVREDLEVFAEGLILMLSDSTTELSAPTHTTFLDIEPIREVNYDLSGGYFAKKPERQTNSIISERLN
jgi:hypothetical protein